MEDPIPGTHWPATTMFELDQYWYANRVTPDQYITEGRKIMKKHKPDWDDEQINGHIVECMGRLK